ncbi:UNVERIFIED_CONTAM: hypothetical protein GTU68_015213 [Idotea baltica]|nr:hypothetical protein [Idotea baltica]
MTTVWGKNFPVLGEAANMLADSVFKMSGGRMKIKIFGSGELVPGYETFDAVSMGVTEMGCGASYYWQGKAPAAAFFTAVPFGMNAQQIAAWLMGDEGEGYQLWKETYKPFNIIPFLGGNTGVQMGGWFNKEINTPDDLKGLKMRIPGLSGKVLEKAGGAAINVPAGEIFTNLERGVIDATEWVGPYHDYKLGLHKAAKYYYYPGWHETGSQMEFIANLDAWNELPEDLQAIMEAATIKVQAWMIAEFDVKNSEYLDILINEEGVQLKEFPKAVLDQLRIHAKETLHELVAKNELSKKVYESYKRYQGKLNKWAIPTEKAYYNKIMK